MRVRSKLPAPAVLAFSLALSSTAFVHPAAAQSDAPPPGDKSSEGQEEAAEAGAEPQASEDSEAEAPVAAAKAEAANPEPVAGPSFVQRLPGSAYPEPQVRGIAGGSLWSTFHGLQWPYVPQTGASPETTLGLSGSIWADIGYKQVETDTMPVKVYKRYVHQGRGVLRATPTYTKDGWFVQAQGELVANSDATANQPSVAFADDLWVRAGRWNVFDVQVGRYEGWELYHLGMGLDLNTVEREGAVIPGDPQNPPTIYGTTTMFYRPASAGNVAAHVYPFDFLRLEVLGQFGSESGLNAKGVRPAAILDLGIVKLKAGGEIRQLSSSTDLTKQAEDFNGFGGAVQVVLAPYAEFGLSGARGYTDRTDAMGNPNLPGSNTTTSFGGFANARLVEDLLLGVGAHYTTQENLHLDGMQRVGEFKHTQAFGALQYLLFKQLYIKGVFAWAKGDIAPSFTDVSYANTMWSGRLRLLYAF